VTPVPCPSLSRARRRMVVITRTMISRSHTGVEMVGKAMRQGRPYHPRAATLSVAKMTAASTANSTPHTSMGRLYACGGPRRSKRGSFSLAVWAGALVHPETPPAHPACRWITSSVQWQEASSTGCVQGSRRPGPEAEPSRQFGQAWFGPDREGWDSVPAPCCFERACRLSEC
jgi:hypothetical protein